MSNPTVLASRLVPFALSTDGITYKNVVCKKTWGLTIDKQPIQDESDCGVHTAVGNATKWSFSFEFILNTTPNGVTEWTADQVAGFANDGTYVYVKTAVAGYYRQGGGYITNLVETAPLNGFITVTGTFTGDGVLDITA